MCHFYKPFPTLAFHFPCLLLGAFFDKKSVFWGYKTLGFVRGAPVALCASHRCVFSAFASKSAVKRQDCFHSHSPLDFPLFCSSKSVFHAFGRAQSACGSERGCARVCKPNPPALFPNVTHGSWLLFSYDCSLLVGTVGPERQVQTYINSLPHISIKKLCKLRRWELTS